MRAAHTARSAGPLQFVNLHGARIHVPTAQEATAKRLRRGGAAKAAPKLSRTLTQFEVWAIPIELRDKAARRASERRAAWEALPEKLKAKRVEPAAWNEAVWLEAQPLKRTMRNEFGIEGAAELAAQMLVKQGGWLRVTVLRPGAVVAR